VPVAPNLCRILVVSDSFHDLPEAVALLGASGHQVGFVRSLKRLQDIGEDEAPVRVRDADAIIMGRVMTVDAAALELARNLKVIALHTSGRDNVDIAAATRRGVLVTNVKGVNAEQCADFAMALMLAAVRKVVLGDRAIRQGRWAADTGSSLDVTGATLGLIGLGQIGRAVVRRAVGFNMRILVNTRTPDAEFAARHAAVFVSLDELLEAADIVCVTASLTPETVGLIGERELARMKPSAYLVNIARGELVDEAALYRALAAGRIAGAGLDVFATEPLYESPLFALGNVVLTPHQAGLTASGKLGAALRAARSALQALAGDLPPDALNPEALTRRPV
jgi:phosphoglycerate dehydrogenase-like enzyme